MPAKHDADIFGVSRRHFAKLQAEVETRSLPGEKAERSAENITRQLLGVGRGGDRDYGVGMDVIDMGVRNKGVQRRVDRARARIEVERAMIEERDHLVLVGEAAIEAFQAFKLVEIQGRKAVALHRAEIAAGALDPEYANWHPSQGIARLDLGGSIAATEIGDAQIAAEQIRAVEQSARLVEAGRNGVIPKIGQRRGRSLAHRASPVLFIARSILAHSIMVNQHRLAIATQYD